MKKPLLTMALVAAGAVGCERDVTQPNREYFPDMADSVSYESYSANPVTPGGRTMMAPAPGSIPRSFAPLHYAPGPQEATRAATELKNPFTASEPLLERGKVAFQRYCSPCHGSGGLGDGPVAARFPRPPSLLAEHARGLADGQIFHIITHGQGLMPAHGSQVAPEDRWKVVHYIRALQSPTQTAQKVTP